MEKINSIILLAFTALYITIFISVPIYTVAGFLLLGFFCLISLFSILNLFSKEVEKVILSKDEIFAISNTKKDQYPIDIVLVLGIILFKELKKGNFDIANTGLLLYRTDDEASNELLEKVNQINSSKAE